MPANGDDALVVRFFIHPVENGTKSLVEGRPIYDDVEHCEIRVPGSRQYLGHYPATADADWVINPTTGEQRRRTYAERFAKQYQQFKSGATQTKSGTPLDHAPFLTEGKRAELRALSVLTVEQLALIDGQELKNLGVNGRTLKNSAQEYLSDAKRSAPSGVLLAELEAMRAKNQILEEDLERARKLSAEADAELDGMTDDALRDFIKSQTGYAPIGSLSHKTLVRMASDVRKDRAA
jgi:hypothetical protein